MERHLKVRISIPINENASEVIARALKIEADSLSSKRVTVRLEASDNFLNLELNASDLTAMRAGINSFLRWIDAALQVYELASSKA
ncbi:MAG: KEOPS complex subunit Pcc1 [Nitrososphaerota archaeon]|nr:KEOPS complex subunit Pcc1 [Aigarchaeota archaeon]MDW8076453.1 KEOPS complex subunit Pcc1 [Nitrososphaerota archaeon]